MIIIVVSLLDRQSRDHVMKLNRLIKVSNFANKEGILDMHIMHSFSIYFCQGYTFLQRIGLRIW